MSQSNNSVSLGSKVNFFDSQEKQGYDTEREPKDPTTHDHDEPESPSTPTVDELLDRTRGSHTYVAGVNREKWLANTILRQHGNPPLYCPECWYEFDAEIELSDPEHHLPLVEVAFDFDTEDMDDSREIEKHDHRRHRHCPDCGTVSFGGVLGDRETEAFLEVVDAVLDASDVVGENTRGRIREKARSRKENEGMSDESNMEELVRGLRYQRSSI